MYPSTIIYLALRMTNSSNSSCPDLSTSRSSMMAWSSSLLTRTPIIRRIVPVVSELTNHSSPLWSRDQIPGSDWSSPDRAALLAVERVEGLPQLRHLVHNPPMRDEYCGHVTRCRVLIGHTGHLVPGEPHLVVILLRVAAGVSHGEAVPALSSGAPAATYLLEVSTRFYNIWRRP